MKNCVKHISAGIGFMMLFLGCSMFLGMLVGGVYGFLEGMQASMVGEMIDTAAISQGSTDFLIEYNVPITMAYQLLALVIAWLITKSLQKNFAQEAFVKKIDKRVILPIIIMGLAVQFFLSYALEFLPIPEAIMNDYVEKSSSIVVGGSLFIRILAVAIVAPIVEEVFFRGIILSHFRKVMPLWLAVLLSSLMFGVMHGQILWISYTAVMGLLFAAVALREKSIVTSIILHMAINFSGLFIEMIPCQGLAMAIVCAVAFFVLVAMIYIVMKKERKVLNSTNI